MAYYYSIPIEEMDEELESLRFYPVSLTFRNKPVKEWVYERKLPRSPNHFVRIYTGINRYGPSAGESRQAGKDAIRIQVIYRDTKGETLVSQTKRVHRVGGWRKNLHKRMNEVATELPQVQFDSRGEPMTLRKKGKDYFWGSRDYPKYKETKPFRAEEIRCCKECNKTTGLTTIQAGTYCYDCLPINLGAESSEEKKSKDFLLNEIKRTWYSPAQKYIKHWVEYNMAGDGLDAYWNKDSFMMPDGSKLSEEATKDEYFDRMFESFLERFESEAQMHSDENHGITIMGKRLLYVPVGTKVNLDSLGNWKNRKNDQYGVYRDEITSWIWSDDFIPTVIFGDGDIDHMEGEEGKDFDRIILAADIPWEAIDWASTIAFNISGFWREGELCVMNQEPVYDLDIYRNGVKESFLDKAMNAEEIVCSNCEWSWQRSEGGDDLFTCHKCGFDNETYHSEDRLDYRDYLNDLRSYPELKNLSDEQLLARGIDCLASQTANRETFAADDYDATYGKEQAKIRRKLKNKIKKQAIMGTKAGQWSARKSQELKRQYEAACDKKGLNPYKGKKTKSQDNLSKWSKQKWGTASGRKSSVTGEPYFPAKAVAALKKKDSYAKAKRQKAKATRAGKQNARYSDDIRKVVAKYRAESPDWEDIDW